MRLTFNLPERSGPVNVTVTLPSDRDAVAHRRRRRGRHLDVGRGRRRQREAAGRDECQTRTAHHLSSLIVVRAKRSPLVASSVARIDFALARLSFFAAFLVGFSVTPRL